MKSVRSQFCRIRDWKLLRALAVHGRPFGYSESDFCYLIRKLGNCTKVFYTPQGRLAGYWMMNPMHGDDLAWMEYIVVSLTAMHELRGLRLGAKLMEDFEETCAQWGYRKLGGSIDCHNELSIKLVHSRGWVICSEKEARFGVEKSITPSARPSRRPRVPGRPEMALRKLLYKLVV